MPDEETNPEWKMIFAKVNQESSVRGKEQRALTYGSSAWGPSALVEGGLWQHEAGWGREGEAAGG